jgi:hypothetical protein
MDKALEMIKAVYDDGVAEINGREYRFLATTHAKRKKVFGFYSGLQADIAKSDFGFIDSPAFAPVEKTIGDMITYDGNLISKSTDHWDKYPEDYLQYLTIAMGVISYPFLRGNLTV